MKIFKNLMVAFLLFGALSACKKSEGGDTQIGSGSMSAKVDGKDWTAGLAVQASKAGGVLALGGTGNGAQININIIAYSGPKSYPLGGPATGINPNQAIYTITNPLPPVAYNTMVGLGNGSLNVTKDEGGYVEGTFSYTARNQAGVTVTITDGKFKAKVQ
ncbi:MAG: hypothetical protein EOO99_04095 [Pedobacter sp.]|nr:MAG: hypothetical protein EOO99_04095 [Pedobacter sp.]